MQRIDELLNSLTMYKAVLYGLLILVGCAFIVSFSGSLSFSPLLLLSSLGTLVGVCLITNIVFSRIFKAPTNIESYIITALILFFIITPPVDGIQSLLPLVLVAFLAMASKYVLAIRRRHIFNPVAISAVLISLTGAFNASWWIATPELFPAVLVVGILIVRKLRKFSMFFTFLGVVTIEMILFGSLYNASPISVISQLLLSWPIIFFATIMLTEPLTMPPTKALQILYASLVGFLLAFQMPLGPIMMSPELALVVGNIFSYFVSSKQKIILKLKEKEKLSSSIYNYVFTPSEKLKFTAGQYVEWTLPHKKADTRGNRRYFTVASSPTENEVMLGVRLTDDGSSFKKALLDFKKDDVILIGSLKGDFLLPENTTKKLVFLAGGIGITPFRSMVKYLIDTDEKRDIVLFHSCSSSDDFAYADLFEKASKKMGLRIIHLLNEKEKAPKNFEGVFGHITEDYIKKGVPDYKNRVFYISGSNAMVDSCKEVLNNLGISKKDIVTDYFSGY